MTKQLSFFPQWSSPPGRGSPSGGAVPLGKERAAAFFELPCRTILNRCSSPRMPFRWTLNPYRGCEFGCTYCYARYSHEYLGMEEWKDFEEKILVKSAAPGRLERDLSRLPSDPGPIAMGTVTDPYQPAEKRFLVTRRLLEVLARRRGLEISITTKSTLIARDLDLLREIAGKSRLRVNVSLITLDRRISRALEPKAPTPARRLDTIRILSGAGLRAGIFAMPVMPGLTDSPRALEALMRGAARAGATHFAAQPLFLRESARRGFLPRLERDFPALVRRYRREYSQSGYLSRPLQEGIREAVAALKRRYGFASASSGGGCPTGSPRAPSACPPRPGMAPLRPASPGSPS